MPPETDRLRLDAISIYDAAVAGVEPRRALTRALASTAPPDRVRILALGKASLAMSAAALQHLDRLEVPVAGGIVVTPDAGPSPDGRLLRVAGDHPLPAHGSAAAAEALAAAVEQAAPRDEVWVLISGGTTSLIGAPVPGVSALEYDRLMRGLSRAGLPIGTLNRVRKRFSRWGAGRLALACRADRIRVFALSDVPGDALADIGSGPCEPDPSTAAEIAEILVSLRETIDIPSTFLRLLDRVGQGELPETPKPTDSAFGRVASRLVASNAIALDHAAARARALGYRVIRPDGLLEGEATGIGQGLVRSTVGTAPAEDTAWILGGETTVVLAGDHGRGGRCQQLALAAARSLAGMDQAAAILAGGTDGRDGPTDAAGAVVVNRTWADIRDARMDPEQALQRHDAYGALAAAGALLRPGLTGTNVMDVVVVLVQAATGPGGPGPESGPR